MNQENPSKEDGTMKTEFDNKIDNDIDLLGLGLIIWEARYEIIRNVFIASVFSVVIAFILPKTFRSVALLMPPSQNPTSGILSTLSELPFSGLMAPSGDETMSSLAVLKSRSVMESIVNQFDLVTVFDVEDMEKAVEALRDNSNFSVEEEGTIQISASVSTSWFHPDEEEDYAKQLAADITNAFVAQLDSVSKSLKTQQASFQRQFIERRYNQNIEDLKETENRLKAFQEKHGMISLPEQTRVAIETAALLKGQVLSNEVQLGVMESTLTPGHPDIDRVQKEIEELNIQLNTMDLGSGFDTSGNSNLFPNFSDVPELGIQLMRLSRDVEIQNKLFVFLTQQYEEAKIKEAKDTPTVQVLDVAIPIHKKLKPARIKILLIGFVFSSVFSMYYVYFRKRLQL